MPLNSDGDGPNRSSAGVGFAITATRRGFTVPEIAQYLMAEPESKAFTRDEKYGMDTARKAALFVAQRKGEPRQRRHR